MSANVLRVPSPKNGSRSKVSSLKAIRADIAYYIRTNPHNKPWSIVGDPEFSKANVTLNAVCKKKNYESQQLGEATTNHSKLLRTAWFYVTLCLVLT